MESDYSENNSRFRENDAKISPGEAETVQILAAREIENVRSLYEAESRLLRRRLFKDLLLRRRDLKAATERLRHDAERIRADLRRTESDLAEVERDIKEFRPPPGLKTE